MDTTETRLRDMVRGIAREIDTGVYDFEASEDWDGPCAGDWLQSALDVEYVVSGRGEYLGARILITCGGPTIWVDTRSNVVRGYWGGDSFEWSFSDTLGLDDWLAEYWEAIR